jgi:hypothetical protein
VQNTIDLNFGDGEYTFALPLAQIAELQRKTDCGIGALYARVIKGVQLVGETAVLNPSVAEFYALDLVETIRQGLIGGNHGLVDGEEIKVTPAIANKLLDAYVLGQPLQAAWDVAATVLATCIRGFDPPKKEPPAAERAKPRKTKKAASTSL